MSKGSSNIKKTIYLLGDAILDNFYWLENKDKDLRQELNDLGYDVVNYAIDEAKVTDIIHGLSIPKISKTRSYSYSTDKDNKIYPLRLLVSSKGNTFTSIYEKINVKKSQELVVVSMGGNDIKDNILKIVLGADYLIDSILTKEFITNFEKIIQEVKNVYQKVVLVSIYLPYLDKGSTYGKYANMSKSMIEKWNEFLYKMAKKYDVAVLDLSKTIDPSNRKNYGEDDVYLSNTANKCMADCISYIYKNYNGYKIYYAPGCDISKIIAQ